MMAVSDLMHSGRGFPMDHLSASFIAKFETCPLAAMYYREGRPMEWDSRYAEVGSYTHSVIERRYDPDRPEYVLEVPMDGEMQMRHNQAMAGHDALCKMDSRFRPNPEWHKPEYEFSYEIEGVPLVGFIDLLTVRGKTPIVNIDDWKTGRYKQADEQQMRIYTMVISELLGVIPRDITATLCYLREEPKKIVRQVPYTGTAAIKHHIIEDIIKPICDLQFVPRRGQHCARCEYRPICDAYN